MSPTPKCRYGRDGKAQQLDFFIILEVNIDYDHHSPKENVLDKVLRWFGKERRVLPPRGAFKIYKKFGPYITLVGRRESFWRALFRHNSSYRTFHF